MTLPGQAPETLVFNVAATFTADPFVQPLTRWGALATGSTCEVQLEGGPGDARTLV